MKQHPNPEPEDGFVPTEAFAATPGAGAVAGEGRWRDFSPVEGRTQRMHRFTGTVLAAVCDATAGGVDGVALGRLSAREAGEAVLELHEVLGRLTGLQLALLAHAATSNPGSTTATPTSTTASSSADATTPSPTTPTTPSTDDPASASASPAPHDRHRDATRHGWRVATTAPHSASCACPSGPHEPAVTSCTAHWST